MTGLAHAHSSTVMREPACLPNRCQALPGSRSVMCHGTGAAMRCVPAATQSVQGTMHTATYNAAIGSAMGTRHAGLSNLLEHEK